MQSLQKDFWSDLTDGLLSIVNQVLLPATNNVLTTASLLGAQVLAGLCKYN